MMTRHIDVSEESHRWLKRLKADMDAKSYDEVIQRLKQSQKKESNFNPFKKSKDYY